MDKEKILEFMNSLNKDTLMDTLGIRYTDCGENYLTAQMDITKKVHQIEGILHGGASAALAESVGGAASFLYVEGKDYIVNGLEMTVNHVRKGERGTLTATASILHKGRMTHLWQIKIKNDEGKLVCFAKITNIILPRIK